MPHWQGQHTGLSQLAQLPIPEQARRSPGAFAQSDLPGFAFAACAIEQLVALGPAHHKTHSCSAQFAQPRRACIAAIKQMQHPASPAHSALAQEMTCLFTCGGRLLALATPPPHTHHLHGPAHATQQHGGPLPASYHNGPTWLIEDPWPRALQALGEALAHRSQPLQLRTFRFFQHTAIPHTQRVFACLCWLLSISVLNPGSKQLYG